MTTDDSYALVRPIPTVTENLEDALGCQTHDELGAD